MSNSFALLRSQFSLRIRTSRSLFSFRLATRYRCELPQTFFFSPIEAFLLFFFLFFLSLVLALSASFVADGCRMPVQFVFVLE